MLLNTYNIVISPKRKFKLPEEILRELGSEYIISLLGEMLWLQTFSEWDILENKILSIAEKSEEFRQFRRMFIGSSSELIINKNGIASIPEYLYEYSTIERTGTFLFTGKHARVTDQAVWNFLKTKPETKEATSFLKSLYFHSDRDRKEILNSYSQVLTDYADQLKKYSNKKDYRSIERLVGELLSSQYVGIIEICQYQNDGGVDLIAYVNRNKFIEVLYIQCKAGRRKADVKDVRELIGVVARDAASFGILISLSGFTSAAIAESKLSKVRLDLVSAYKLAEWIEDFQRTT